MSDQPPQYKYMPNFYMPGPMGGMPLRWQDEQSRHMSRAIMAFFNHVVKNPGYERLSDEHFEMVREYGQYYINAPCWVNNAEGDEEILAQLETLRKQITEAKTVQDIDQWIDACLEVGIDPY